MASSNTVIANLALGHLGQSKEIQNIETDKGAVAQVCRRFYDETREVVLRDFPWPFATKIVSLSLILQNPNDEWTYSYRYPSDCFMFRRIQSGIRNDTRESRIPYRIARDTTATTIFTDRADAIGEYTINEESTVRFSADFAIAFAYRLAFYIAPSITGGDPFKLQDRIIQLYDLEISRAQANAYNEEQSEQDPESSLVNERE